MKEEPNIKEEQERKRLTKKALEFGLISTEQAIELGYKPKKEHHYKKKKKKILRRHMPK